MAKHPARCPHCGRSLEVDTAVDGRVTCPDCRASLRLPGGRGLRAEHDPLVGQTLGDFEIVEPIGRGGMGVVYAARQKRIDRLVALKVLPQDYAESAGSVARFQREARAAAAVTHPNIIEVIEVGQERGYPYIAMELVDGESLDALLEREGRLPADRALDLLKQTAKALAVAHEAGIVHRDIKPSNILIDSMGIARVADFGLAKRPEVDERLTGSGLALGTPVYMAPEIGRGQPLDASADLYSLGATFYHALAGHPPFEAATAPELIVKHATERPQSLGAAAPHVDHRVTHIIDRLLRKNPEARYPSAKALLDELETLDLPREVPPAHRQADKEASGTRRAGRPVRRRRIALLLAGIGAASLFLAGALVARRSKPGAADTTPSAGTATPVDALRPVVDAKKAYEAAVGYYAEAPGHFGRARPYFQAVRTRCPGTPYAGLAGEWLAEFERAETHPEWWAKVQRELGQLRAGLLLVADRGDFAQAMKQVADFRDRYRYHIVGDEADRLKGELAHKAREHYNALVRRAREVATLEEYRAVRAAFERVKSWGIPELAERAAKRLAELDRWVER